MGVVLAIDNDPSRYVSARRLFDGAGYELVRVDNPRDAERALSQRHVVAVLLDYDMQGWTGDYYVQQVLKQSIPVCVVSRNPHGSDRLLRMLRARSFTHIERIMASENAGPRWLSWVQSVDT